MGEPLLTPRATTPADYGDYDDNGVDLSLIRYTLSLSPWERLVLMDRHARDTELLMEYGRRSREAQARSSG